MQLLIVMQILFYKIVNVYYFVFFYFLHKRFMHKIFYQTLLTLIYKSCIFVIIIFTFLYHKEWPTAVLNYFLKYFSMVKFV